MVSDPKGHVTIDSSGMLQPTEAGTVQPPPNHRYGYRLEPVESGTLVTAYQDWSAIPEQYRKAGVFPIIVEGTARATLGILARTVE